jgi:beta-lactam-binding protein with PASTA domain
MEFLRKLKLFFWSKHFAKHFGLVILFYLVIISVTIFYLNAYTNHGQKIKLPNYIGRDLKSAKSDVEALGLQYEVLDSIYDPTKPEGTILEQDPEATAISQVYVKEGRIIRFRVSKNRELVEVPSLINKDEKLAIDILKVKQFNYVIQRKPTTEADGAVLEQLFNGKPIKPKDRLLIGSTIVLVIGENKRQNTVNIPNLYGLTILEAKQRLQGLGMNNLLVVCTDCFTSEDSTVARISSQSPEYLEDYQYAIGTTVTITASRNFVPTLPDDSNSAVEENPIEENQ